MERDEGEEEEEEEEEAWSKKTGRDSGDQGRRVLVNEAAVGDWG